MKKPEEVLITRVDKQAINNVELPHILMVLSRDFPMPRSTPDKRTTAVLREIERYYYDRFLTREDKAPYCAFVLDSPAALRLMPADQPRNLIGGTFGSLEMLMRFIDEAIEAEELMLLAPPEVVHATSMAYIKPGAA